LTTFFEQLCHKNLHNFPPFALNKLKLILDIEDLPKARNDVSNAVYVLSKQQVFVFQLVCIEFKTWVDPELSAYVASVLSRETQTKKVGVLDDFGNFKIPFFVLDPQKNYKFS